MKKYNKMYAHPLLGGECIFIIAKSKKHMIKILKKTDIISSSDDFECWGKLIDISKKWDVPLKKIISKSGICYMDAHTRRYNMLKNN